MRKAILGLILVLLPAVSGQARQEVLASRFTFSLADGTEFTGALVTPSLSLDTELGSMSVPGPRITSLQFERGPWSIQIGRDHLVGRVLNDVLNVKTSTGVLEVPVARIVRINQAMPGLPEKEPWPPASDLKPVRTLLQKCAISGLRIAPDGKSLYFIEASTEGPILRRLDTERPEAAGAAKRLARGLNAFRISGDGRTIVAFSEARARHGSGAPDGRIAIFTPPDLAVKAEFTIEFDIADLQLHPGGMILVSGWGPRLEPMAVVNPASPAMTSLWNISLSPSTFRLISNGRRAIASSLVDNQGAVLSVPDDLEKGLPSVWSFNRPRGEKGMSVTPDEKFIVWQSGTVTRVGASGEPFPAAYQTVPHRTAIAATPEGMLLFPTLDGTVARASPPDFRSVPPVTVGYPWYEAAVDSSRGLIYAAIDRRDRPFLGAGQSNGDLCVFDLKPFLRVVEETRITGAVALATDGELKPIKVHALAAGIRGMAVLGSPTRFLLLDGTEGVLRSFTASTGETSGVSAPFPHPVSILCVDTDRQAIHVFGAGPSNSAHPGCWYQLDPATLSIRSATWLDFVPGGAEVDPQGRLWVTQEGGARSELWILDPARKAAIGRWNLEADRVQVRVSRAAKAVYFSPPFRACALPADEALAKPVLTKAPGPLAGLTGERFQISADGVHLLFESGVVFKCGSRSPTDLSYLGVLSSHRSAAFLDGRNRLAAAEKDGRLRIVSIPDLKDVRIYRTNQLLYSLVHDPSSGVLCAASGGSSLAGVEPGVGPVLFYKVPE